MAIPSTTKLVLLYTFLQVVPEAFPFPRFHSQSQEGDYNVRADFKDIAIVLMPSKEMINMGINMALGKTPSTARQVGTDRVKSKYGYIRPEKSPYKVDLEKSNVPLIKVDSMPEAQQAHGLSKIDENKKTVKKDLKPTVAKGEMLSEEKVMGNENKNNNNEGEKEIGVKKEEMISEDKVIENKKKNGEKIVTDKKKGEVLDIKKDGEEVVDKKKMEETVNAEEKKEENKVIKSKEEEPKVTQVMKEKLQEKEKTGNKEETDKKEGQQEQTDKKEGQKEQTDKKEGQQEKTEKGMKLEEEGTWILVQEGIEECGPEGHRNQQGICVYTVPA